MAVTVLFATNGNRFPYDIKSDSQYVFTFKGWFTMFRIMLCCSAGMSTSMLVRKMVEEAESRGLPVKIDAYGVAEFDTQFPNYQVVLLGPQVKYMLTTLSEKAATQGVPVKAIDMMDYGMQRGDKVLDYALSLIEAAH
jgi:PTS system cellobiose-specific IIB component